MRRVFPILNAVIAIGVGLIVLTGYFVDLQGMMEIRLLLFQWAVIIGGVAVLVGIGNLLTVHLNKLRSRKKGAIYSLVLLFFMLISLLISGTAGLEPLKPLLLDGIIIPVEISLMAVLAITLVVSAIRMLRTRLDLPTILFILTAFIVLLGIGLRSFFGQLPILGELAQSEFIKNTLALGGARGILIGIALGTLTTGLRILLGVDRPYGGK
ncbi:MAG: hypothetical protein DDG60_05440 [Anaerolineae bacterium]|nr:MAG: hypothetical protein DDG60_05440 [Anaerolineae bacterium]